MRLPEGYETQLGQRGRNVSMGQRQLISFARALVADPQILILDEATANIDSFTEQAIQKALKVLFAGRTGLVIAHRLTTVRDADQIIVLQPRPDRRGGTPRSSWSPPADLRAAVPPLATAPSTSPPGAGEGGGRPGALSPT